MANIKQAQQMIPLIACETSFGWNVCELVSGVDVFDLDLGIQIDSIEQPIKSNSAGILPLMIILITASLSSFFFFHLTCHYRHNCERNQIQ